MKQQEKTRITHEAVRELVNRYELNGNTTLLILENIPDAVRVYKRGYKQGLSYDAIKIEVEKVNHSIGGWLYQIAEEIIQKEEEAQATPAHKESAKNGQEYTNNNTKLF